MRKHGFWRIYASLVLAVMVSSQVNAAATAALVSDVAGTVTVKTASGKAPAKLLAPIPVGATLDLPAGASLSLIYVAKGDEYKLSGPGSYQVGAAAPQAISGGAPARAASIGGALSGKKIRPEQVSQATMTMRGIKKHPQSLEPLIPSGTVTLADPLQLQWMEPTAGLVYQVQLIDSQNKALVSQEVTGSTFTLPPEISLTSGGYYLWNVATTIPDGSVVNANGQFRVASNETRAQAAKIRPGKNGTVSERVVYGLWLETENLGNEARLVWRELAAEFPDQPGLFDRSAR